MHIIRSLIFWIFFYLAVFLLVSLFFPISFIVKKKELADDCAKLWSQTILWLLKTIHKIDHKVLAHEKMPQTPCIIACKHQSAWETVVFHLLCKHPGYIYKKELLSVPFYGWYVKQMTGAKVDRKGGASALKDLIKQAKNILQTNHNIVLFPQGTRVPVGSSVEKYPYQVGIAALYLACNVPVVPVALNSGKFWPKGFLIKKSGTITIQFLDPIMPGLKKEEFMEELARRIDKASDELLNS